MAVIKVVHHLEISVFESVARIDVSGEIVELIGVLNAVGIASCALAFPRLGDEVGGDVDL